CVVADFDALPERLQAADKWLGGTKYTHKVDKNHADVTCPWGNRIRLHRAGAEFGFMTLGMPYVEVPVPSRHGDGGARFYPEIMGAPARLEEYHGSTTARVHVGHGQSLLFRETSEEIRPYDGYHIAVYVTDFGGSHAKLNERGIVSQESNPYQYRFQEIVDPESGKLLYEIEHEVRSFTHPMYARPLVNRNPAQRQPTYQPGQDAFYPRYSPLAFHLDLDEGELAGVGIHDVVLGAGVAIVGSAGSQLRDRLAGGAPDGERPRGQWHDDIGVVVTMVTRMTPRREAP